MKSPRLLLLLVPWLVACPSGDDAPATPDCSVATSGAVEPMSRHATGSSGTTSDDDTGPTSESTAGSADDATEGSPCAGAPCGALCDSCDDDSSGVECICDSGECVVETPDTCLYAGGCISGDAGISEPCGTPCTSGCESGSCVCDLRGDCVDAATVDCSEGTSTSDDGGDTCEETGEDGA